MDLSIINKTKYLKAPPIEDIKSFIAEIGVSDNQFERFYGIPFNMITQIRAGTKPLPAKYWHFFYEKIKPAYGIGFIYDYQPIEQKELLTKALTKQIIKMKKTPEMDNHGRLGRLKTK